MVFFVLGTTNRRGDDGERGKEAAVESQMRQAEG
jgi:hypothetical protein